MKSHGNRYQDPETIVIFTSSIGQKLRLLEFSRRISKAILDVCQLIWNLHSISGFFTYPFPIYSAMTL